MVSPHGTKVALLLCSKAVTILGLMLVLVATAPLHVTLQAAHSLRAPSVLVQLALLTYRYAFLLAGEFTRLRIALRVRGYRNRPTVHSYRTVGHAAATLLVQSAERGERVSHAMRCRGFDGRFRSLAEFRTTPADVAFFATIVFGAAALLAWDLAQR
jgi:cobalt/nickel transport system permease protein